MTERFVPIGRELGLYGEEQGRKFFTVGNGIHQVILSDLEHFIWKHLKNYTSLTDWKTDLSGKLNSKFPKLDFNEVVLKLLALDLMKPWDFKDIQDDDLVGIFVVRNGTVYGNHQGKWKIGDFVKKDERSLTKEQYTLWNAAAGGTTLLQVVDQVMEKLGLTEEAALQLLTKQGYFLIRKGLWNTEYLGFLVGGGEDGK
ncbi:hypothetical protein LC048_00285 [Mesobacillus subterraneus]|uniref:hypothetical protein n=1 Tax=Mesobacillus subterraneus TaxID=285983 RepID=UPI00273DACC2|nr:hypothetical protein [Mesobacillus subterraneus]WLR55501.1 hypothetical protein LC048_00285 [Mesobacillus subterraneus]